LKFGYNGLRDLIYAFSKQESTDLRDKVYGLLALLRRNETSSSNGTTTDIHADYTLDLLSVYAAMLKAVSREGLLYMDRWRFLLICRRSLGLTGTRDYVTVKFLEGVSMSSEENA
jgi:phosphatidylglycerophosphate synthase